jgi:hypothetical protein
MVAAEPSKINAETNMRHSTDVNMDNAAISDIGRSKRQGFQQVYQSRKTSNSSHRVQVAYNCQIRMATIEASWR